MARVAARHICHLEEAMVAVKFPTRDTKERLPRNTLFSAGSVVNAVYAGGKSAYGLPQAVRRFATSKEQASGPEYYIGSAPEAATISCLRGGQAAGHEGLSMQDTHSRTNAARGTDVPMNVLIVTFSYVSSRILPAGSARTGCLSSLMLPLSQTMR